MVLIIQAFVHKLQDLVVFLYCPLVFQNALVQSSIFVRRRQEDYTFIVSFQKKSNSSRTNLQCAGGALEASATVAVVGQDAEAAVETAPCAHR